MAPDDLFDDAEGNTPLSDEERRGLIPALATRAELNEWERENILLARRWALAPRQLKRHDALTEDYLQRLHRKMFDRTWRWAGRFRVSERNLGLPVHRLATATRDLLEDARYWLAHQIFGIDEIAVRVHHRLVSIHPWPNGNGRHARLLGDVLVVHHGQMVFSWGRHANLVAPGGARVDYLAALRAADQQDYAPLASFARS